MPQGPTYCTYWVRVPASGVGYVPRTVAPQVTTYVINAATAVYSLVGGVAAAKQEPVGFWFGKILLLGGLALGELREIDAPETRKKFPNQK